MDLLSLLQAQPLAKYAGGNNGKLIQIYGAEGSGKTYFLATANKPIIISAGAATDGGLGSASGSQGFAYQALYLENAQAPRNSLMHIIRHLDNLIKTQQLRPDMVDCIGLDNLHGISELILQTFKGSNIQTTLDRTEITRQQKDLNSFNNANAVDAILVENILPVIGNWANYGFKVVLINHEQIISDKKLEKLGDTALHTILPWGTHRAVEWLKRYCPITIHTERTFINTGQMDANQKFIKQTVYQMRLGHDDSFFTKANVANGALLQALIPNNFNALVAELDRVAGFNLAVQQQSPVMVEPVAQPAPQQQVVAVPQEVCAYAAPEQKVTTLVKNYTAPVQDVQPAPTYQPVQEAVVSAPVVEYTQQVPVQQVVEQQPTQKPVVGLNQDLQNLFGGTK